MADETIRIEIETEIDGKKVKQTFGNIESAAKKSGLKTGKAFGQSVSSSASRSLKGLVTTTAVAFAAISSIIAGREIIAASVRQQDAINGINASLRRIGESSRETSRDLQDFASQIQATTRFGDEAVLEQLAFAQALGATAKQSKVVVEAATDLAAAFKIDFNSAVRNVGKTLGGFSGELGEVIPELKAFTAEQLKAGAGVEFLASKFRGAAAADVRTFGGSIDKLKNSVGDIFELFGNVATQSPSLRGGILALVDALAGLGKGIQTISQNKDIFRPLLLGVIGFARAVNELIPIAVTVGRAFGIVFRGINTTFALIVAGIGNGLGKLGDAISTITGGQFGQGLIDFGETSAMVLDENIKPLNEALGQLFDPVPLTENIEEFLVALETGVERAKPTLDSLSDAYDKTSKKIIKTTAKVGQATAQIVNQAIVQTTSRGIQAMTKSLILGADGFKGFGQQVLSIMGDMSIKLGESLILTGIGIESLKSLSGAAAIAAGAGLIALGTIIKSFSGDAQGLTPGGAGVGGGGFSGGGVGFGGDEEIEQVEEREEPSTQVAVTIQGDVLDSDETGTRLVQILNDAFEQQGIVVTNGSFA